MIKTTIGYHCGRIEAITRLSKEPPRNDLSIKYILKQ